MEAQEVFDQVVKHLYAQKSRAREDVCVGSAGPGCRYRTQDGKKCAIGCLIRDDEYGVWMEGAGCHYVLQSDKCPASLKERLLPHLGLLDSLQYVHDATEDDRVYTWPEQLKKVADRHNLKFEMPMKKFKIAVEWTLTGELEVEATSMEAAIEKAHDMDLPEGEYLSDSFTVTKDLCKEVSEEEP